MILLIIKFIIIGALSLLTAKTGQYGLAIAVAVLSMIQIDY